MVNKSFGCCVHTPIADNIIDYEESGSLFNFTSGLDSAFY